MRLLRDLAAALQNLHPGSNPGGASNFSLMILPIPTVTSPGKPARVVVSPASLPFNHLGALFVTGWTPAWSEFV